jgi:hypothetical protein
MLMPEFVEFLTFHRDEALDGQQKYAETQCQLEYTIEE